MRYRIFRHFALPRYGTLAGLLWLVTTVGVNGQNLVPNPSFEDHIACPCFGCATNNSPMLCPPWWTYGSCDYFHACSSFWSYAVPNNAFGGQFANTGDAYIGAHSYAPDVLRELAYVALLDTLEAGHCYKVGFYLNLGDTECGIDHFGALLSPAPLTSPLGMTPQIDLGGNMFTDTINWVFVFGYIIATGNEAYITIGNFYHDAETTLEPDCSQPGVYSYFFIDDVIVEEVPEEEIDVELDGPISACDSVLLVPTVDPEAEDILYIWSDGTRNPTLMVYTSGQYSVTVYYGCNSDVATVDVTIYDAPPVQLADDEIIMCAGNTYDISLDPSVGTYEWQDGSTSPDYSISSTGQYSVTLDDGCHLSSDTIDVLVVEPPDPISLGVDTFLCPGGMITYSLDPAQGEYVWQDGSNDSVYPIDEAGTYSVTVTNMCGVSSDEVEVIDIIPPIFDIGPDTTHLCVGQIVDITLEPTMGSFHWQDGNNSPFYVISQAGVYSITVTNGCGMETDQMIVDMTAPPLIQLGPDTSICMGDTVVLDGGVNTGNYLWQNGSTNNTFEVTTAGQYALSITNACGFDRDSLTVASMAPLLQPNLGPDINLCPGEQATVSIDAAGASIVWNDLSTTDSLLIVMAGIYYVQVSNACEVLSDTINVFGSGQPPSISLAADFNLCQGDSTVLEAGITGVTYMWNDGSQNSQLSVYAPGQYILTVSNNCGADSDTIQVGDGGPPPSVSLGNDTSICLGTIITILPTYSNVDNWSWQDGSIIPSYNSTVAGEIHVIVSNTCGVDADTLLIGLLPAVPNISLGADTSICIGDTLSFLIDPTDVEIVWQDGTTNANLDVTEAGPVIAMISNSCGSFSDTLLVSMYPQIPQLDLGMDQSICPGETIVVDPGISGVSYLWQDGSTGSTLSITQQETIILEISNECGSSLDTLEIYESTDGPQVDLGADIVACAGDTVMIASHIVGVNYQWQDGSTVPNYQTTISGTYILQVSNLCGSDRDSVDVEISGEAPVVDLGKDTTLCEGNTLLLSYVADPITTVQWQDGSDAETLLIQSAGIYSLTATNRCGYDADSIEIKYMDAPDPFDLGADTTLCPGESYMLSAPATTHELLWQNGSTFPQLLVTSAGSYVLEISNMCGKETDSVKVSIEDLLLAVDLGPDTVLCPGASLTLDATQTVPAGYIWNTGDEGSIVTVTTPGLYAITVFTPCQSISDERVVGLKSDCQSDPDNTSIYIPNVFSPNDDQINDLFRIDFGSDIQVLSINGSLFDRWGNLVYRSDHIPFRWDGQTHDLKAPPGTYVYLILLTYQANGKQYVEKFSGDVTLIR